MDSCLPPWTAKAEPHPHVAPVTAPSRPPCRRRTGQCYVRRYWGKLLERIERGEIDPSFVITHRMGLDDAPQGYDIFTNKEDNYIKIVLKP